MVMPFSTYMAATFVAPDKSDDFGMGPFLGGAIIGGILSIVAGIVTLVTGIRMRAVRPLGNRWLLGLERIVLISPSAGILAAAVGLVGSSPVGAAAVYIAAAALSLVQLL